MPNTEDFPAGRRMKLGLFAAAGGAHLAGWRHPASSLVPNTLPELTQAAQLAERGLFDFVFLTSQLNLNAQSAAGAAVSVLDPIVMLAGLAGATSRIGLIATASTTYSDPFNLARQLLSLDHLSGGRAGWNIVTTSDAATAANFSQTRHPDHEERYGRAGEFVSVVKGLWNSLPQAAILRDKAAGRFFDPTLVRAVNHAGRDFTVKGPLNLARSPQGAPVLVQAGASEPGRNLAARHAELVFSADPSIEVSRAYRTDILQRAVGFGRPPGGIAVMPGVMPILGRTRAEAISLRDELTGLIDSEGALRLLSHRLGQDLTSHDLDDPVPDLDASRVEGNRSRALLLLRKARDERLTLRQLHAHLAAAFGHAILPGDPEEIADTLIDWFRQGAADGFVIMPAIFQSQLQIFVDQVVPILQQKGAFRDAYATTTLRGHLGLDRQGEWA